MPYFQTICSSINSFALNPPTPYSFFGFRKNVRIEVGTSNIVVDVIRNVFALPTKLFFLNPNMGSGRFSQDTLDGVSSYLQLHNLQDVQVSANQYKPQMVWKRIFSNPRTNTFSKYTFGVIAGLYYTFSFNKVFNTAGDYYDPFSNVVHLTSNDLAIALHRCSLANHFCRRWDPTPEALQYYLAHTSICHAVHPLNVFVTICRMLTVVMVNGIGSLITANHCFKTNQIKQLKQACPTLIVQSVSGIVMPVFQLTIAAMLGRFSLCENHCWQEQVMGIPFPPSMSQEWVFRYVKVYSVTAISVMAVGHLLGHMLARKVRPKPLSFWNFTPWASKS